MEKRQSRHKFRVVAIVLEQFPRYCLRSFEQLVITFNFALKSLKVKHLKLFKKDKIYRRFKARARKLCERIHSDHEMQIVTSC